jgi:hypothetical protein
MPSGCLRRIAIPIALLFALAAFPSWADTCSYSYHCSSSACAELMGGWSRTLSQSGITKEECERVRLQTIPGGSTPCTCTADGSSPSSTDSSGVMISNTGNTAQDLVTNGVNLFIASHTTNQIMSSFMQGAATGFISSMFAANSPEAQRQRLLMQQEILRRQQEQERQRRLAEQRRFDAMYARLTAALKLDGLPFNLTLKGMDSSSPESLELKGMKTSGPGDLKLKLADSSSSGYGIKGLPGIYVGGPAGGSSASADQSAALPSNATSSANPNLVSGPGTGTTGTGTTGPGIPGLPGIYLDGVQPAEAPQLAQAAENLQGPERALAQDTALQAAGQNPALTAPSQDPNVQNFQQTNQEYRKALAANTAATQDVQTAQAHVESDKAAIDVARTQLNSVTPSVQQQQKFNDMLAAAKTDEEAKTLADKAFDSTQVNLSLAREKASTALAALTPASAPVAANNSAVVDLSHATRTQPNLLRTPAPAPAAKAPVQVPSPVVSASAPVKRHSLDPVVDRLCSQLDGAQNALRRLMETQNTRNEDRAEWEKTINDASDAAWQRGFDMIRDYTGEQLSKHLEGLIKQSDDEIEKLYRDISAEKDPLKVGRMQKQWEEADRRKANLEDALRRAKADQKHLDEMTYEREYLKWAPGYDGDLVGRMEGLRQIVDIALGDPGVQKLLTAELTTKLKLGLSISDSGYDIMREVLAAQQIKQLNQNADDFLRAQAALDRRIQQTVKQLNDYKAHNPEGAACSASPAEAAPQRLSSALK